MPAIGRALRNRHGRTPHPRLGASRHASTRQLTLSSPAFDHGTPIPERHRGRLFAANISPALAWTTPPADTAELILVVQDPDVPIGKPATHALTRGIAPTLSDIPENGLTDPSPIPGLKHGKGPLGRRGWAGPLPPRSHGPHTYVFQLFALDYHLSCPTSSPSPTHSTPWSDTSSHAPDSTAPTKSNNHAKSFSPRQQTRPASWSVVHARIQQLPVGASAQSVSRAAVSVT
jgi:phosphatidylethanolamine-binding protein (PEBP) family uncharacterized protein